MKLTVAVTLICALSTPSLIAAEPQTVWSSVRQLAPGTRITVTTQGEPPHTARFLVADDAGFKALDVPKHKISAAAGKVLIRLASEAPDQLTSVTPERSLRIDADFVLSASGLFARNRKVADYDRVVETISRSDVETGIVRVENAPVGHRMETSTKVLIGVGIGVAIAFASGYVIYAVGCVVGGCD